MPDDTMTEQELAAIEAEPPGRLTVFVTVPRLCAALRAAWRENERLRNALEAIAKVTLDATADEERPRSEPKSDTGGHQWDYQKVVTPRGSTTLCCSLCGVEFTDWINNRFGWCVAADGQKEGE